MKRFGKRFLSGILVALMLSSLLCTAASARSSAYLNSYRAMLTPKAKGFIVVTVDVAGTGRMTEIGASTIYIYESTDGSSFYRVGSYDSATYPQMLGSGTSYYEDPITYLGKPGRYYYASVYVYAANDSGSDEKNYQTSIVQAIS